MKEYQLSYMTLTSYITLDEYSVKIKQGPFVKKDIALNNLHHFYVMKGEQYNSLYWIYTNEKGKRTKFISMASSGDAGFAELTNELLQRFPEKSLNHLPEKEAFKTMNVANPKKWAPLVAFVIIFAVLCGFMYPGIRHYLDFGFSKVPVSQLIDGSYSGSRNISVSGILLDQSLEETTTTTRNGSTTTSVSEFIPIVDENWKEGDPVKVFLSFSKLTDSEYTDLFDKEAHLGVIRNIAWEGMSNDQVKFFKDHYGMTVDKDPLLIEITNKTHNDEWVIFALTGCVVIIGVIFLIVAIRRRKR